MKRIVCDENIRVNRWVAERMGQVSWADCRSIGLEKDGELVAGVVYDYFNHANVCMHVAGVGKHWLNREYLWYCFYYPFEQLKVRRVTGLIAETNTDSRRFAVGLGFEYEARLQGAHPTGDLLVYRMFKDQCRWLGLKERHGQA